MLERLTAYLSEPLCEHCPSVGERKWTWSLLNEDDGTFALRIHCKVCNADLLIPYEKLQLFLVSPKKPTKASKSRASAPPAPQETREPVTHCREFTKMDISFLKSLKISTDGIDFKD